MSTEPSGFFCSSGICEERLADHAPDERVELAVVGGDGPVLRDGRVGRDGEL